MAKIAETPLMKQYLSIKAKYPDAILLFRVGDFYETFSTDAIIGSKVLGITLTKRKNGAAQTVELAGFPHHSLETYLPKLVKAGYRVAICDQLEDPKKTKTIVKRGVTELVTPGVAFSDKVLDNRTNNFLAAIHFSKKNIGVSFLDVSTGEFLVAQGNDAYIKKLLANFSPSEILYQRNLETELDKLAGADAYSYKLDDWVFTDEFANEQLLGHFNTKSFKGFGVQELQEGIIAAGAIFQYLKDTQHEKLSHITALTRLEEDHYVWLDKFTIRNLELVNSFNENGTALVDVLDRTQTPMGGRLLKRWLLLPLKDVSTINNRLEIVSELSEKTELKEELTLHFKEISDLERLISKVAVGRINPRELQILNRSLKALQPIKNICAASKNKSLKKWVERINTCDTLVQQISDTLHDEPPVAIGKGEVIRMGVDEDLDKLKQIAYKGKDYLLALQERESAKTGIPSLKIAFNNVFGYYIEVRNTHKDKVPEEWHRKQTLVNAERYITEELKEYEQQILGAEEKILALESKIFNSLMQDVTQYILTVQQNAHIIAGLDCLKGFAELAEENKYCKPTVNDGTDLVIEDGRHPVIEKHLTEDQEYISNNISLSIDKQQIMMITGPNMSGKSAYLRQNALIVLMAQMGCFVPASMANIGIVDKIFTRVGASDNISSGESTFMVEMNETASILNNISERSLILLDEIGRGTSTYDGVSIAWAIAEFLHENGKFKPKTLFATHYHELNNMNASFPRIVNYNVQVKEIDNSIHFLRKIIAGGSAHSFGIHVAEMAGMPKVVIKRANDILKQLEKDHDSVSVEPNTQNITQSEDYQLSFFKLDDPTLIQIKEEIQNLDINTLTPVEALMKLNEIKKLVGVK